MKQDPRSKIAAANACDPFKANERLSSIKRALRETTLPVLVIEASAKCNLSCAFCGMHSKSLSVSARGRRKGLADFKRHMDLELFKETIRKSRGVGKLKVLYLHGNGEPLLNPHIVEMVDFANRAEIAEQIVLVTNGVRLSGKTFKELVDAGASSVRVSFDIFTPEKFLEVKGANEAERVRRNVDECIQGIRANALKASLIILCGDPDSEDRDLSEETTRIVGYYQDKIADLPNVRIEHRKIFNWVGSINRITDGGPYRRPVPCEQPFYLLMVHADGDVSMCCADVMKELVVGRIQDIDSIREILGSEALHRRRKWLLEQDYKRLRACGYCEVYSAVDAVMFENRQELLSILSQNRVASSVVDAEFLSPPCRHMPEVYKNAGGR